MNNAASRWLIFLPLAGFLVLAAYFALGLRHDPTKLPSALLQQPTPSFVLPSLSDAMAEITNQALHPTPILINFFASWCEPCRDDHTALIDLAKQGVPILGIAYKDAPEKTREFLHELGDPYRTIALDKAGRTAIDFGVYGVPETFIVNREGRIVYRSVGSLADPGQRDALLAALARAS